MSRVFDALRNTGSQPIAQEIASSAAFVDALEKGFAAESVSSATMLPGGEARLAFQKDPRGPAAERYRLLRLRLRALQKEAKLKVLLVTSPGPQDGKSTVALNLASALAEKGDQKVLLLEADLRRPSLDRELGLKLPSGLAQSTGSDSSLLAAMRRIEPAEVYLLPGGKPLVNPAEVLNSEWFPRMIKKLQATFDWIVIDSPPAIPVVDTLSIKNLVDAILLVVRAGQTQQPAIEETFRVLGTERILGIVLNGVEGLDRGYYEYYQHYVAQTPTNGKS